MASTLVQIRVDEKLKDDAAAVYEGLGLDLSIAVRIFFKRSVAENGIPFSMKLGNAEQNTLKKTDSARCDDSNANDDTTRCVKRH